MVGTFAPRTGDHSVGSAGGCSVFFGLILVQWNRRRSSGQSRSRAHPLFQISNSSRRPIGAEVSRARSWSGRYLSGSQMRRSMSVWWLEAPPGVHAHNLLAPTGAHSAEHPTVCALPKAGPHYPPRTRSIMLADGSWDSAQSASTNWAE